MYTSQQAAPYHGQQQSVTGMPSSDYHSILSDVSNHMPRSDLLHRLSTQSSSASNSNKRGTARITKQNSASNSPHNIQRRRTTANHTSRAQLRVSHDTPHYTREQMLHNNRSCQGPMSFQRPMSWHPGTDDLWGSGTYISRGEPAVGNTIVGLENLVVSGTAPSSVQQSIQDTLAMGCGYPINTPIATYEESPAAMPGYGPLGPASEPPYNPCPTYSISDMPQYPVPHATSYKAYPAPSYPCSQQWPTFRPGHSVNTQAPQAISGCLPAEGPVNNARQPKAISRLARKKSKELVGMGLYDDQPSDYIHYTISHDPTRDSLGKGLKLEETWQPPDEDEDEAEDEDGDEAYSTDEAEDVEESPPPFVATVPAEGRTAVYPSCGDLSNQSFFFNDEDEYINDDQYANIFAYGQGLSEYPPKSQPSTAMQNYLWL